MNAGIGLYVRPAVRRAAASQRPTSVSCWWRRWRAPAVRRFAANQWRVARRRVCNAFRTVSMERGESACEYPGTRSRVRSSFELYQRGPAAFHACLNLGDEEVGTGLVLLQVTSPSTAVKTQPRINLRSRWVVPALFIVAASRRRPADPAARRRSDRETLLLVARDALKSVQLKLNLRPGARGADPWPSAGRLLAAPATRRKQR